MAEAAKKTMKVDETVQSKPEKSVEGKADNKISYYEAVGRRKTSTSRVRLYVLKEDSMTFGGATLTKGAIVINGKPIEKYFPGDVLRKKYMEPFRTTNTMNRFVVSAKAVGGGTEGQLSAFIHAASRALTKVDMEKFRPILKKRGFLTRDPRAKERRKAGYAGKARARKQSPKR